MNSLLDRLILRFPNLAGDRHDPLCPHCAQRMPAEPGIVHRKTGQPLSLITLGAFAVFSLVAAALGAAPACPVPASSLSAVSAAGSEAWPGWMPDTILHHRRELETAAADFDVPLSLLAVVALVESGGDPMAQSGSGARGLMQIMPATAAEIEFATGEPCTSRPFDARVSIRCGAWYLARRWDESGQNGPLAAAGYNGGPGALRRAAAGLSLPAETARYRYWTGMVYDWPSASSSRYAEWSSAGGQRLIDQAALRLGIVGLQR